MSLSQELIAKFVKVTNDSTKPKTETTLYGTIVDYAGEKYVKIDGSDNLTPLSSMESTADIGGIKVDDRVTVLIKNHTATITGNLTSPSVNAHTLNDATGGSADRITRLEVLVADKVSTDALIAVDGRINSLEANQLTVNNTLNAQSGVINDLMTYNVTVQNTFTAHKALIDDISAKKIDADVVKSEYASIERLKVIEGDFHTLESTYASFSKTTTDTLAAIDGTIKNLDTKYTNIDFANIGEAAIKKFYSTSGIIKNLTVSNGTYTGELAGVKISGDLITANTVVADKLVIKGTNGLYYKLNTDGMKTEAEQTNQNSLDGSVILAKSITATKISVTDLVAFGATIGGFHITDNALYSGVKSTVGNTTRGSYLDTDGQVVFGDKNNYVKYFKDTDSVYKLAISARDIILNGGSLSSKFDDLTVKINDINIGGRNLLRNSKLVRMFSNNANVYPIDCSEVTENGVSFYRIRRSDLENYPSTSLSMFSTINKDAFAYGAMTGKQVTLSFKARASHAITGSFMDFTFGGDTVVDFGKAAEQFTTEWKTFYVTIDSFPDMTNRTGIRWSPYNFQVPEDILGEFYLDIREYKFEFGNKPTDWTPAPEDVEESVANASKTATNYLNFTGTGLVVGDMTKETLGGNVLIDSDSVDIRSGTTVLASYGASNVYLGKNNKNTIIDLCNGLTKLYATSDAEGEKFTIDSTKRLNLRSLVSSSTLMSTIDMYSDRIFIQVDTKDGASTPASFSLLGETGVISLMASKTEVYGELIIGTQGSKIHGVSPAGTVEEAFQAQNEKGNTVIGWGNYSKTADEVSDTNMGNTNIYGQEVHIGVAAASRTFRPYYHGIDTISDITFRGAGYVTSTGTVVYFVVPLSKHVIGKPTVTISSIDGFTLRQNNKYTHGSSASAYVHPTKYAGNVDESGNYVRIAATFGNSTNVTNNSTIGIDWHGKIVFSYG